MCVACIADDFKLYITLRIELSDSFIPSYLTQSLWSIDASSQSNYSRMTSLSSYPVYNRFDDVIYNKRSENRYFQNK